MTPVPNTPRSRICSVPTRRTIWHGFGNPDSSSPGNRKWRPRSFRITSTQRAAGSACPCSLHSSTCLAQSSFAQRSSRLSSTGLTSRNRASSFRQERYTSEAFRVPGGFPAFTRVTVRRTSYSQARWSCRNSRSLRMYLTKVTVVPPASVRTWNSSINARAR